MNKRIQRVVTFWDRNPATSDMALAWLAGGCVFAACILISLAAFAFAAFFGAVGIGMTIAAWNKSWETDAIIRRQVETDRIAERAFRCPSETRSPLSKWNPEEHNFTTITR